MIQIVNNAPARKVPPRMQIEIRKFLSSVLRKAGLSTALNWEVRFKRQKKGTPHTPEFDVRRLTPHQSVELELKPAGNESAHVVELMVPPELAPQAVLKALKSFSDSSISREQRIHMEMHEIASKLEDLSRIEERLWVRLGSIERRREEAEDEMQRLKAELQRLE